MSKEIANLQLQLNILIILSIGLLIAVGFLTHEKVWPSKNVIQSISANEIKILDNKGITRAVLSGNVPNAIVNGEELERGTTAAGILLYDKDGQERSGYLTFDDDDHVVFTLDSKLQQQALFVAGADGVASLKLWQDNNTIELRADSSNARLTTNEGNKVTAQLPEIKQIPIEICELFKTGIKSEVPQGLPRAKVKGVCEKRFSAQACLPCLPSL